MKRVLTLCLFCVALAAAAPASAQQAAPGFNGGQFFGRGVGPRVNAINRAPGVVPFFGGGFGGGAGNWAAYGMFNQSPTAYYDLFWEERVPYFAMHPPVYYSAPVPRTYGYSPFAYSGDVRTPEIDFGPPPATIINPHAQPEATPTSAHEQTTGAPLRIRNPYVEANIADADDSGTSEVAASSIDRVR